MIERFSWRISGPCGPKLPRYSPEKGSVLGISSCLILLYTREPSRPANPRNCLSKHHQHQLDLLLKQLPTMSNHNADPQMPRESCCPSDIPSFAMTHTAARCISEARKTARGEAEM